MIIFKNLPNFFPIKIFGLAKFRFPHMFWREKEERMKMLESLALMNSLIRKVQLQLTSTLGRCISLTAAAVAHFHALLGHHTISQGSHSTRIKRWK